MDDKPDDFDWVTARHGCSALQVFEQLRLEAAHNVKTLNALRPQAGFEFFEHADSFGVVRPVFSGSMAVRFSLAGDEIDIQGRGVEVHISATLTLNDAGECRLKVGTKELTRSQVLRRALEPLLFREIR
jgi:hypothetical protein